MMTERTAKGCSVRSYNTTTDIEDYCNNKGLFIKKKAKKNFGFSWDGSESVDK